MAEARTYTDVPGLAFYPDSAFLWAVLICRTVLICRAAVISGPLRSGSEGPIPAVARDAPP